MTLRDWLTSRGMSDAQFAQLSGIGQRALVQKYRHGRQFPAPENLRRIREATNGAVTADDFVDQHAGPSPPTAPAAPKRKRVTPPVDSTPPAPPKRRAKAKAAPSAEPAAALPSQDGTA